MTGTVRLTFQKSLRRSPKPQTSGSFSLVCKECAVHGRRARASQDGFRRGSVIAGDDEYPTLSCGKSVPTLVDVEVSLSTGRTTCLDGNTETGGPVLRGCFVIHLLENAAEIGDITVAASAGDLFEGQPVIVQHELRAIDAH